MLTGPRASAQRDGHSLNKTGCVVALVLREGGPDDIGSIVDGLLSPNHSTSWSSPEAYKAAEIAAKAREALIAARLDFCSETVFSHESKVDLVASASSSGYDVVLHVVMIPLRLSGPRVAARVANGGHGVPAEKLETRYERLWPLVVAAVPMCHRAVFCDNSADAGPFEVGSYRYGVPDYEPRWPAWSPDPVRRL